MDFPYISDAAANDLLSTLLTNNEIFVTENDQVFHQMQNMQTENDQTENHQSENDQVFHQRQNMQWETCEGEVGQVQLKNVHDVQKFNA